MSSKKAALGPAVGMIGLGLLGSAIVERLLASGFEVLGHDVDSSRADALGIASLSSAREIAERAERIVVCVPDSDAVEAVAEGPGGLVESKRAGRLLVDCTTGEAGRKVRLAERLASCGIAYVEASISGSSAVVRRGDGVALVGAEKAHVERVRDLLDALADVVYVLGPVGSGARMKLVSNLVLGLNRLALAEGLALAERAGLDASTFLEVIRAGPAHSRALEAKGEKMLRREYEPQARLAQHLGDVRLMVALGDEVGATVPTTRLHAELLARAVKDGLGDADNAAIVELLRHEDSRSGPS